MLVNLKRLYVRMRSFPQARFVADLLLAVDPSALSELRDRGLLAYHMEDFAAALRDLETYLRLMPRSEPGPRTAEAALDAESERRSGVGICADLGAREGASGGGWPASTERRRASTSSVRFPASRASASSRRSTCAL